VPSCSSQRARGNAYRAKALPGDTRGLHVRLCERVIEFGQVVISGDRPIRCGNATQPRAQHAQLVRAAIVRKISEQQDRIHTDAGKPPERLVEQVG
jgi:hypothetical protein